MFFCEVHSATRWFGLAALLTLGLTASAQQTIQFSEPVNGDPASKANAVSPVSTRRSSADAFNAPTPLFGGGNPTVSFDILPGSPQPVISGAAAAQWQKHLEDSKNWTLMTPEEILGIPTPEKILGIPDPNDDPGLSPEQRFLQREERQSAIGVSNALHRADSSLWHHDDTPGGEDNNEDDSTRFAWALREVGSTAQGLTLSQRRDRLPNVNQNQKPVSAWVSPFDVQEPLPKETPEQLAGMDRFRALMEPSAPEKPLQSSAFFVPPVVAPDPNMEVLPAFNPAGRAARALPNDIGKPKGLMPLTGITGTLDPAKKTAPSVRPPPWMQDPLQNSSLPQRQY
jgi:hypothetical protein